MWPIAGWPGCILTSTIRPALKYAKPNGSCDVFQYVLICALDTAHCVLLWVSRKRYKQGDGMARLCWHRGEGGGAAPTHWQFGTRRRWVVRTTPRLLYPPERPGTHCAGGFVGLRTV
jgi:hypothetical protein